MSTASATVTQGSLTGTPLIWTDTGLYGSIVSRTLVITDYQNNVVETISLGSTLIYDFVITADNWYCFTGTVIDNTGTFVSTVYYVSTGFYTASYLAQYASTNCGCIGVNCNMEAAENAYNAALRFNLAGLSGAASSQASIVAANVLINANTTVQLA